MLLYGRAGVTTPPKDGVFVDGNTQPTEYQDEFVVGSRMEPDTSKSTTTGAIVAASPVI